eukprot:6242670-Pyramimonas_sp.AAC.1
MHDLQDITEVSAAPDVRLALQCSHAAQDLKCQQQAAGATGFFLGGHATVRHFARLASRDDLK